MNEDRAPNNIASIVFAVLIIGTLICSSFWILQPFLPAFIWAGTIVIASWSWLKKAQRFFGGSRTLAVITMTSALVLVFLLPLTIALSTIIENIGYVSQEVQKFLLNGLPPPPEWLQNIPIVGTKLVDYWQMAASAGKEEWLARLYPYVAKTITWLLYQLGGMGRIFVHFLLTLILAAILYAQGETAAQGILKFAKRLAHQRGEEAIILAAQAIRAVANGVVVTAILQAAMTGFGLLITGVPYVVILTSITFLLCVIQIGAAPVLFGSLIWLYYNSGSFAFWSLLIWTALVLLVDNFIRPILIKRGANLPLLLIFAGVIGGLFSFGVIGIFVGPVVLAVSYTLLKAWTTEGENSLVIPQN